MIGQRCPAYPTRGAHRDDQHDHRRPRRRAARRHPPARHPARPDPGPPGGPAAARPRRGGPRAWSAPTPPPPPTASAALDVTTGTKLARAFSTYFHLANITEQVHRARELRRRRAPRRRLAGPGGQADRRARACRPTRSPRRPAGWRSARSSPRTRPRRPAARSCPSCARSPTSWTPRPPTRSLYGASDERPAPTAASPSCIDLLWQTDELRLDRPDPTDEARNAVYYLRDLYADAAPQVLDDLADDAAHARAWRPRRRPGR